MRINLSDRLGYWKYPWDVSNIDEIVSESIKLTKRVNSKHDGHGI